MQTIYKINQQVLQTNFEPTKLSHYIMVLHVEKGMKQKYVH